MILFIHPLADTPPAYVQVQATAQPAAPGRQPYDPSRPSPNSAPAGAPQTPPNVGRSVAPAAGTAGSSDVAQSSAPPAGHVAAGSDNGGQLASPNVPGGVNHAPNEGPKSESFSAPIKKD